MPYSGLKCSHCSAVSMEQRRMAKVTLPKEGKQVKWSPFMKSAVHKQTFCTMGGGGERRKCRVMRLNAVCLSVTQKETLAFLPSPVQSELATASLLLTNDNEHS